MARSTRMVRIAVVLPTEFAYARDVMRGILEATRERNMYGRPAAEPRSAAKSAARNGRDAPDRTPRHPWQFRVFRGLYARSTRLMSRWFRDWEPDGVICQIEEPGLAPFFRDLGKPVVEVFERIGGPQFPHILPDDVATGAMAAEHFLQRGFRNFGFFGDSSLPWARKREAGFREGVERFFNARAGEAAKFSWHSFEQEGFPLADALDNRSHGRQSAAMALWLASLPRPVAVFAAGDMWGFELVQAAREAELHVPDDVAVLGVDNDELLCEISHPPLSSIRIGGEQMGQAAVELLERLLRRKSPTSQPVHVPPLGVVTRQSTDVLAVDDPEVAAALRHIRRHALEGLSVKQMLDAVAVNRRTLERRFVKVLGHTPLEEIRRVRLERVKLLLQTDMPIYEVAVRCGFATPEYLATSFLQATGMTPTEYRRALGPRGARDLLPA
jgi:LacI family transcriptional regulator